MGRVDREAPDALRARHHVQIIEIETVRGADRVIAARNQHDIADTYKLAKSIGAQAWYMFMIVPTGRGKEILDELISKEDYEEILEWHFQMEKQETDILVRPAPSSARLSYAQLAETVEDALPAVLAAAAPGAGS